MLRATASRTPRPLLSSRIKVSFSTFSISTIHLTSFLQKCSTNINRQQPTFRSVSCKSRYTAISMSATTKATKSGKIRYLDSHEPSEPFCCWRRSHLRKQHSRIQQEYREPSKSPLPWGKDCIDRRDRDRTSSPALSLSS
jgi:hypothetical protein